MLNFDVELDLSGLNCPIPVLKVRSALHALKSGQVLKVLCTDPLTQKDLPLLCQQVGAQLLQTESKERHYLFWIQK